MDDHETQAANPIIMNHKINDMYSWAVYLKSINIEYNKCAGTSLGKERGCRRGQSHCHIQVPHQPVGGGHPEPDTILTTTLIERAMNLSHDAKQGH